VCKKSIKNSQPFVKKIKNVRTPQGGDFFDSHCSSLLSTDRVLNVRVGCMPVIMLHLHWLFCALVILFYVVIASAFTAR